MSVSREQVVWCYRLLLGREPESEAVVASHMRSADLKELRRRFLGSEEFASQNAAAPLNGRPFPLALPADDIQTQASRRQLDACIAKVGATWNRLGSTRPHFSVLTDSDFLPENLAHHLERFWRSGETECASLAELLRRHGCRNTAGLTCVEYGCGLGRVTLALARRFAQVHAYDVSERHLAAACQRAAELGVANVHFHLRSSALAALEPCEFFYSRLVFQHNPPPLIAQLIRLSLQALRPGGIAVFQLPVYRKGYRFELSEWLRQPPAPDMEMHCFPQRQVFELIGEQACSLLEIREGDDCGPPFLSNTFVVRKHGRRRLSLGTWRR